MNTARYTPVARALHWLMALVIFVAAGLAIYADNLPDGPEHRTVIGLHIAIASTVLLWIALRILWRATHPAPPLPATMSPAAKGVTHLVHSLMYLLMIATPVAGWLMVNAKGFPVKLAGLLPLPTLLEKSEELHEQFEELHIALGLTLVALAIGHAIVALKHHFVDRDEVMLRMMPPRR
jgi:cytochrome b561